MTEQELKEKREAVHHLLVESLRAAEMRQGCTNYGYYVDKIITRLSSLGVVIADKDSAEYGIEGGYTRTYPLLRYATIVEFKGEDIEIEDPDGGYDFSGKWYELEEK